MTRRQRDLTLLPQDLDTHCSRVPISKPVFWPKGIVTFFSSFFDGTFPPTVKILVFSVGR